jgi:hypothetical protein
MRKTPERITPISVSPCCVGLSPVCQSAPGWGRRILDCGDDANGIHRTKREHKAEPPGILNLTKRSRESLLASLAQYYKAHNIEEAEYRIPAFQAFLKLLLYLCEWKDRIGIIQENTKRSRALSPRTAILVDHSLPEI